MLVMVVLLPEVVGVVGVEVVVPEGVDPDGAVGDPAVTVTASFIPLPQ